MRKLLKKSYTILILLRKFTQSCTFSKRRTLYRTMKGNWFLFYHANNEIVPKTDEEIKEYLGERDVDLYMKYFDVEVEEA